MTAAKLRLLRVLRLQLITDRVKQFDIALLWVLLECGNESPGHRACGLAGDLCVLPIEGVRSAYQSFLWVWRVAVSREC